MKSYSLGGDEGIARYVERTFRPEDEVLREVRERCAREGLPDISLSAMDALHLEVLTRACGARRAVEVGTLGGYSGIAIARGLAGGGRLDTFEIDPHHAEVARESFRRAGVLDRVEIHVGPALERLRAFRGDVDLVFIDADKEGYPDYLAWASDRLRIGGLAIGDNTFAWGGIVEGKDSGARALRAFNEAMASGGRFRATVLPTGEGLTVGVKVR
jgi:caffeoyl-CoA O-methyltransferase